MSRLSFAPSTKAPSAARRAPAIAKCRRQSLLPKRSAGASKLLSDHCVTALAMMMTRVAETEPKGQVVARPRTAVCAGPRIDRSEVAAFIVRTTAFLDSASARASVSGSPSALMGVPHLRVPCANAIVVERFAVIRPRFLGRLVLILSCQRSRCIAGCKVVRRRAEVGERRGAAADVRAGCGTRARWCACQRDRRHAKQ